MRFGVGWIYTRLKWNWTDHHALPYQYTDDKRLKAVDLHLAACMETPVHPLQQYLKMWKIRNQSINYAIILACILRDDAEARQKLRPWLPKGPGAWVKCMHSPPPNFMWLFMIYLLGGARQLSVVQEKLFLLKVSHFNACQDSIMHDLIHCYGMDYDMPFDMELKWVLYKYSLAVSVTSKKF